MYKCYEILQVDFAFVSLSLLSTLFASGFVSPNEKKETTRMLKPRDAEQTTCTIQRNFSPVFFGSKSPGHRGRYTSEYNLPRNECTRRKTRMPWFTRRFNAERAVLINYRLLSARGRSVFMSIYVHTHIHGRFKKARTFAIAECSDANVPTERGNRKI